MKRLLFASFSLAILILQPSISTAKTWYIKPDGTGAYPTIQGAIDASMNGDTVVVEEGLYAGPGNTCLDFKSKSIVVMSRNPIDFNCIRNTVIDAGGQGYVVCFCHDEGPQSVLDGFTLIAGDTSLVTRGTPGFVHLSYKARPTTRRLRIEGLAPVSFQDVPALAETVAPYPSLAWDGLNPFHQPAATTNYYGSGDVNLDGRVTAPDIPIIQEMVVGTRSLSTLADVNGDGAVTNEDVLLVENAIRGETLSGWWNYLPSREARESWVSKIMEIDLVDEHPYRYWFQCGSFASQLYINAAHHRQDLFSRNYDGGQTKYNLPMYFVGVYATGFGHGINGILVGDDPLCFDDWRFIEPQNDNDALPGMWDMPYGSTVQLKVPYSFSQAGSFSYNGDKIQFYVDESGWTLVEYDPELVLVRSSVGETQIDNRTDLLNPLIVSGDRDLFLFERFRDDMSRVADLHITDFILEEPKSSSPLILSSNFSRLLDVAYDQGDTLHLLWTGKPDYIPGVFHGVLHRDSLVTNITRVSEGTRIIYGGRIVITKDGDIHVFWMEAQLNYNHPYESGIYWTRWTGKQWEPSVNLTPGAYVANLNANWWEKHDSDRVRFDAVALENGEVVLVWIDYTNYNGGVEVYERRYNENWGSEMLIIEEIDYTPGLDLETTPDGTIHLALWASITPNGDGSISHRSFNGSEWSEPDTLDNTGRVGWPQMAVSTDSLVYLVWEGESEGQIVPAWSQLVDGCWQAPAYLNVCAGSEAWYPKPASLSDGRIAVVWSSRCNERMTIKSAFLSDPTGVADRQAHHIMTLHQNHPNPFNPTTTIRYSIPNSSHVNICIYNVHGQLVKTLLDEEKLAGEHFTIWDGTNARGNLVSSGVYFYRLKSGVGVLTRKMVLIR